MNVITSRAARTFNWLLALHFPLMTILIDTL
jgi:hypothetical protein